jgi:hypothetical protein
LVQAITEFFFNRPVMSREEFQQLVEARHQASKDAEAKAEAPKPA